MFRAFGGSLCSLEIRIAFQIAYLQGGAFLATRITIPDSTGLPGPSSKSRSLGKVLKRKRFGLALHMAKRIKYIFISDKRTKETGIFFLPYPFGTDHILLCELSALSMAKG